MLIFHGTIFRDEFVLWAENAQGQLQTIEHRETKDTANTIDSVPELLPFAATYSKLREALTESGIAFALPQRQNAQITAWLPTTKQGVVLASSPIIGLAAEDLETADIDQVVLSPWIIPALRLSVDRVVEFLCYCVDREQLASGILLGEDLQFWALAMRFAGTLVCKQQFLPGIRADETGENKFAATWEPVFLGEDGDIFIRMAKGMPGICLTCAPLIEDDTITADSTVSTATQNILVKFLNNIVDCLVRKSASTGHLSLPASALETPIASSEEQSAAGIHVRWLKALTGENPALVGTAEEFARLSDQIAEWRRPIEIASDTPYRLCFRLEEPLINTPTFNFDPAVANSEDIESTDMHDGDQDGNDHEGTEDSNGHEGSSTNETTPEGSATVTARWYLRFLLQSLEDPSLVLPVETVLSAKFQELQLLRGGKVSAREYLFRSLGQAVRLYPEIASSFSNQLPDGISLDTEGAYNFLSHKAIVLKNAGFSVHLPSWWKKNKQQIKAFAKMRQGSGLFGLDAIAEFDWQLALGSIPMTIEQLEALAQLKMPLIYMNGNWVEINPEQIQPILNFFKTRVAYKASGQDLVKMALGGMNIPESVIFDGIAGDHPLVELIDKLKGHVDFEQLSPHELFNGTLRPYQNRGFSWLEFLRKVGFGACLADDMGLGKTIQTLAFIQSSWYQSNKRARRPSLLVCPTSVIGNWQKEAQKFTPDLDVLLHHGTDRLRNTNLLKAAKRHALILTTYNLLHRDNDDFKSIDWQTVILDEAQNIKNPLAHQSRAAFSLRADFRIALTGTPIENSVADLWSLMHFLNPGFLGRESDFAERFFIPIQVYQDQEKLQQLKELTAPFILRRLKTDKTIAPDLPEKFERKTHCHLTKEQATLYGAVVEDATGTIEAASGLRRKSLILTTLLRLKQICNHPALILTDKSKLAGRSGKLKRLTDLIQEVMAIDEKALVFTQFKQMGSIIQGHLQAVLGKEVLFLHGGIDRSSRVRMIERFQNSEDSPSVFVLSLKAGGSGLNLTNANHVFHFDRWWNPAVEDQATDRAFRIGQSNNVQVHKFICTGTLEDRIDELIEGKKILAASAVGSGEAWLTELSTKEIKDIISLRSTILVE